MNLRELFGSLIVITMLVIPSVVMAGIPTGPPPGPPPTYSIHSFDCDQCHGDDMDLSSVADMICLKCHKAGGAVAPTPPNGWPADGYTRDGVTDREFSSDHASNAMGYNNSATLQISHNWATPTNYVPAAGAQAPVDPSFATNYGASSSKLTCSSCHLPHEDTDNPQLLVMGPGSANDMCLDCHRSWNHASMNGFLTHPMVTDYITNFAGQPGYKATIENTSNSNVQLVDGNVTCTTCHGVHWVDSRSATTDGYDQAIGSGDGKLLVGDGENVKDGGTGLPTGGSICTACHDYENALHGENGGVKTVGCLACHGGHNYNDGDPTWYMLNDPTGAYAGGATPPVDMNVAWVGSEGVVDGFCESCHGDISTWNGASVDRDHDFALDMAQGCSTCHAAHSEGSFSEAAGCTDCHGWPPNVNSAGGPNGYADANIDFGGFPATTYNYQTNNGTATFLNEANTGHSTHAAGGADEYNFSCSECHKGNTHNDANGGANDNPTFQDVFLDPTGVLATTVTLGAGPEYNNPGSNDCLNVYCHSDGVNPDRTIAGPNAAVVPNWDTAVDGGTNCASCHNTGTTGTATVHNTHLALTLDGAAVTCGTCHDDTWETTNDLKNNGDGSIVASHVDGDVDVTFNTTLIPTNPMDQVNGTCAVYCHSNGTTPVEIPDWDLANTGNCGDCHDADGVTGDSVAISSGSHTKHLNEGLTCADCHTHDGSAFGGDHINGVKDVTAGVCNTCHGATVAGTGVDAEPVWGNSSSVTCNTCHQGALAVINTRTAPDATAINPSGNAHGTAGYDCNTCHDIVSADVAHLDGTSGNTDRLSYASSDAACNDCHGDGATTSTINGINTHQAKTCATCHDPHYGGSNLSLVRETSSDYSGTVVFTATTGADSYDEPDAANADDICATCHTAVTHNRADATGVAHNEGTDCFNCHKPHTDDTSPFGVGAGTNCADCHGYPPASGAHVAHTTVVDGDKDNPAEDFSDCAACHGADVLTYDYAGSTGGNHLNSSTDFTAGLGYDDNGTRGNTADDPVTTCAGACHSTAAGQAADWLTTSPLSCDSCHGGLVADATTISSGDHTPHISNASLDCDACHNGGVIPTDYSHISDQGTNEGEILYNSAVAVADDALVDVPSEWNDTNNTCSNAACHDPSNQNYLAEWNVDTADCTLCHGDDASMSTNKHSEHLGSGVTINCTDCHIDNGTNDAHLSGAVEVTDGAKVSVWSDPTCTNSCHTLNGDGGAASWTAANPLACSDCHTAGKTGLYTGPAGDQTPTSGLHAPSNALDHVTTADAFDGASGDGCELCHNSTPTTTHINGVGPQDSNTATYNTWNATYVASYSFANGCASSCHSDNEKWSRKWIGVSDTAWGSANPGDPKCDNCHGDGMSNATTFDGNWQAGVAPVHETDWDGDSIANEVLSPLSSHGTCQSCHGYNGAGYDKTYTNADGTTSVGHGDSYITMNGPDVVRDAFTGSTAPQGAQYNSVDFGCMAACHTGDYSSGSGDPNEDHVMADSAWPVNYGDFGSGDCDTCHASFGADHTDTNESAAMHSSHSGSNYVTSCNNCHPHDGLSVSPGTGVHNDGWVDFNGTTLSTTGDRYSRDSGNYDDSCTNNCHDVDNSTGEWAAQSLGADRCTDCHAATGKLLDQGGYLPTSGEHNEHIAADADYVDDCNSCHGANANTGAHTGHIDNAANITIGGALSTFDTGNNNCTNTCHTAGDVNEWTAGSLGCTDCHSSTLSLDAGGDGTFSTANPPATGKHDEHMGNSSFVADCANCHTHNGVLDGGTSGHVDGATVGTITINTAVITGGTLPSCTNVCHDVTSAADDGWVNDARTLECADCHSSGLILDGGGEADISTSIGPNAGRHDVHMANSNYVSNGCVDCHGHEGSLAVGAHADASVTLANETTAYAANDTCTNSCHLSVDGRDWIQGAQVNGTALACADCHNASGKSLDQGAWPPSSNAHLEHSASNALPNATQSDCYACHNDTANNSGALTGSSHLNLTAGDVIFDGGFDYEAGTAGVAAGSGGTTTCSAVVCHSGVTTPTWGAGTISCGQCHNTSSSGPLPSGSIAGSHSAHANNDGDFADCTYCHANANSYSATGGDAQHQNLLVNIIPLTGTYSDATAGVADANTGAGVNYGGDFTDNGTCATVDCHFNNITPAWGGTINGCTACHNDGTDDESLAHSAPASGEHNDHMISSADASYLNNCESCHGTGANTAAHSGHSNLSLTVDNDTGDANEATGGSISNWDAVNNTCTNSCHIAAIGEWDEATDQEDGTYALSLDCSDCHFGTYIGGAYASSGQHPAHNESEPASYSTAAGRTVSGTGYDFNCNNCHAGGTHMNGAPVEVAVGDWDSGAKTCQANTCHDDGLGGGAALVANWSSGWVGDDGDTCNNCHGNSPSTNAHGVHEVGIHYEELYDDDGVGLMAVDPTGLGASGGADSAHGNAATSTTINCFTCHSNTVVDSANANNSTCTGCHSDTDSIVTGNEVARIQFIGTHVDGTKNVVFSDLSVFKSKAQLRDNLADADDGSNILSDIWNRLVGYKPAAGTGYDQGTAAFADAGWDSGAKTCSTAACHNGNTATWTDSGVDCMYCHTSLPK